MRPYFIGPILLALVACASHEPAQTAPQAAAASAPASGVSVAQQSCHRETKLGTNLYQTVCNHATELERQETIDGVGRLLGPQAAGSGFGKSN